MRMEQAGALCWRSIPRRGSRARRWRRSGSWTVPASHARRVHVCCNKAVLSDTSVGSSSGRGPEVRVRGRARDDDVDGNHTRSGADDALVIIGLAFTRDAERAFQGARSSCEGSSVCGALEVSPGEGAMGRIQRSQTVAWTWRSICILHAPNERVHGHGRSHRPCDGVGDRWSFCLRTRRGFGASRIASASLLTVKLGTDDADDVRCGDRTRPAASREDVGDTCPRHLRFESRAVKDVRRVSSAKCSRAKRSASLRLPS